MNSHQAHHDTTPVSVPPFLSGADRRRGARSPLALDVVLYHRNVPIGRARTRDMSLKGACIETRHRLDFDGSIVQVKLTIGDAGDARRAFMHARVAHRSGRTLGIRFLGFDHAVFRRALEALHGPPEEAAAHRGTSAHGRQPPVTTATSSTVTSAAPAT